MSENADSVIIKMLLDLKNLKKSGQLDKDEYILKQEHKWRNEIEYEDLKEFLIHRNDQVRLQTLELIAISNKSTLGFTNNELNLITTFLTYNFGEKMEFVPLMKKILKRLCDSYTVLNRTLNNYKKLQEFALTDQNDSMHSSNESSIDATLSCTKTMLMYKNFITSLHNLCFANLYDSAVNVRRKYVLQILDLMDEILKPLEILELWTCEKVAKLIDCILLDTYQDNKELAFKLIKKKKYLYTFFKSKDKILEFLLTALDLANSIRPLDSMTASYMLKVILILPASDDVLYLQDEKYESCKLNRKELCLIKLLMSHLRGPLNLAKENIVSAAANHSFYGFIYCIHSILETVNLKILDDTCWKSLISDLVNMCFEFNNVVSQIVYNSSPEGHLPMDLNPKSMPSDLQSTIDTLVTPQMVLLCSWRTVKETGLLFGFLTKNVNPLLSTKEVTEIGNHLVKVLYKTKHRGAFEQAYVGFSQLCKRLSTNNETDLNVLPKIWLQQILLSVIGVGNESSNLCSTRRSAGVPFMIQAIVTSEIAKGKDPKTYTFHRIMKILLNLCELVDNGDTASKIRFILKNSKIFDEECSKINLVTDNENINSLTEIKTHSMNILRALYKFSLLSDVVKEYIADGVITAIKCYDGQSWTERNAATLLFSALVIRIFGVQRTKDHVNLTLHNKMTGKIFFEKFPKLLGFLMEQLEVFLNEDETEVSPKIQSILILLSRLYSGASEDDDAKNWEINKFITLVSKCGKSKVYKTRELAARALNPLITKENIKAVISELIVKSSQFSNGLNLTHGYVLQISELIRREEFVKTDISRNHLEGFLNFLDNMLNNLETNNNKPACFPIATTALEILMKILELKTYRWITQNIIFEYILEKVNLHSVKSEILKKRPGRELYEKMAAYFFINNMLNADLDYLLINNLKLLQFWKTVLSHKNEDVQIISWLKVHDFIEKTKNSMLNTLAVYIFTETLDEKVVNCDLEDARYSFVNFSLTKLLLQNELCQIIIDYLTGLLKSNDYYAREEIFKLLCSSFGKLLKIEDHHFLKDKKRIVYESVCNYSEMGCDLDCRIGISKLLFELFIKPDAQNIYFSLEWWTTLLNLLFDDSPEVRFNACQVVCKIKPESQPHCIAFTVSEFFEKFSSTFQSDESTLLVVLFVWSMLTASVDVQEMDETDVFNKSYNYEVFEPLQITSHCIKQLKKIQVEKFLNNNMPLQVKKWVQKHLSLKEEDYNFKTPKDLIFGYNKWIVSSTSTLKRITDPTYPSKMIKEIAFNNFVNSL